MYFNPNEFHESFALNVDPAKLIFWPSEQKPFNQSNIAEASGSLAWKQLPTWYQISENDCQPPPDMQRISAERLNANVNIFPVFNAVSIK